MIKNVLLGHAQHPHIFVYNKIVPHFLKTILAIFHLPFLSENATLQNRGAGRPKTLSAEISKMSFSTPHFF